MTYYYAIDKVISVCMVTDAYINNYALFKFITLNPNNWELRHTPDSMRLH